MGISGAAQACGCAEGTLRRLEARGIIHPTRDSAGRRLFTEADIAAARAHLAVSPNRAGRGPIVAEA